MTFTSSLTLDMDARGGAKTWFASQVHCTDVFRTSIFDTCTNRQESISVWKVCLPSCHSHRPELVDHLNMLQLQSKARELARSMTGLTFYNFIRANNYDTFIDDQNYKRHDEECWRHKPRCMDSHWRSSWSTGARASRPLNIKKVSPLFTLQQ